MDINIFVQIGFVVLVGLASKNAILIVEFAKQQREAGRAAARGDAGGVPAAAAADPDDELRVHPRAWCRWCWPQGAGAEMRRTLGIAVFSGMLGVTLFGIFLTPVFFYVIGKLIPDRPPAAPSAPTDQPHANGPVADGHAVAVKGH